jgi:hypothetical protein
VREPIWPQVATALDRAANGGSDLTDDLPNLVNGQWVASLRLMHDPDRNPTGSATEPAPATAGQGSRTGIHTQTHATPVTRTQSAPGRSR